MNRPMDEENAEIVEKLFTVLNYMGNDRNMADAIIKRLEKEHPTIAQTFWRVVKMVAARYQTFNHDMRNEGSVALAKVIAFDGNHLPFL